MSEQPDNQAKSIRTGGGPAIEGGVDTGGGDFAGRDKITNVLGDEVHGDKIGGDKVTIGTIINNLFKGDSEDVRKLRNRQAMLKLVHDIWVKGVLEHSLYNQLLIDLDMEQRPEAVERPWGMMLETPEQASRLLPSGTKMIDVFTELNQSLLILGEPGSGKSTMLLELARDLLAQAVQNPALPMPVLFNLSSWAEKRQPLRQWLVDELRKKYQIPKTLAQGWVEHDELLLLLDGLDEVKREHREACIKALNEFQQSCQTLVPLALCSRSAEYEALTSKLKLNGAIVLRPLTPEQIDGFLLGAGEKLSAVAHLIQHDADLQILAQSPLTFSIICLTYQEKVIADIQPMEGVRTRLQQLFDAYILRMFQRSSKLTNVMYSWNKTLQWLRWLAQNMVLHDQSTFLIEGLQPDWLQDRQRRLCMNLFLPGLITLLTGPLLGLADGWKTGLISGATIFLSFMLFYWLIDGFDSAESSIEPVEQLVFSWKLTKSTLIRWSIVGLIGGPIIFLILAIMDGSIRIISRSMTDFILFIIGSSILGLPYGVSIGLMLNVIGTKNISERTYPNQGIKQSIQNFIIAGLIVGLVSSLLCGSLLVLVIGYKGWILGMIWGIIAGAVAFGAIPSYSHGILRLVMYIYHDSPLNYARFLDYCADRIFLRKVGGGYIFVHRLLMEHFASLTEEDIKRLASSK